MNRKGDRTSVAWRTGTDENHAGLFERSEPDGDAHPSAPASNILSAPNHLAGEGTTVSPKARWGARRSKGRRDAGQADGNRMGKTPIFAAVKKVWIVLVIVAVVAVAGFCVVRLRGVFGYHDNRPITSGNANDIKPFNPKHVVYEVYGPPGTVANINYLDINAQPQKASNVPLPWTLSVITTLPSVAVNIVAQADTDQIGCRIIVNDVVKDERSATGVNAQTFCIVKSA
jgi:hypothetical protein